MAGALSRWLERASTPTVPAHPGLQVRLSRKFTSFCLDSELARCTRDVQMGTPQTVEITTWGLIGLLTRSIGRARLDFHVAQLERNDRDCTIKRDERARSLLSLTDCDRVR